MTTVAAHSKVGAALRRRALALVALGIVVAASAVLVANPYFAPGTRVVDTLKHWPYNVPQIGAAVALVASLIAAFGIVSGRAQSVRGWMSFGAVLIGLGIFGWFGNKDGGICTPHLCVGRVGHVANWWIYWGLIVAALACAFAAVKVAEEVRR